MKKWILFLLLGSNVAMAIPPQNIDLKKPPPKVIRTCCAFGVDVKVVMLPFMKINSITAIDKIGQHHFLGNKVENNGIIYTQNGGFIDLGHLRDIADMTAYIFALIKENKKKGLSDFKLGREGGLKTISFKIPPKFNDIDIALLAGRIAYDISTWHEISTWFGVSSIPFVAERYSSFSVEDAYSNLLGVHLSMNAINSDKPYEQAMTDNIAEALSYLNAVQTLEDTKDAMLEVKDIWWSGTAKFPNRQLLKVRQFEILNSVSPLLINDNHDSYSNEDFTLRVPSITASGYPLNDLYHLKIKYNLKIPVKKILGENYTRTYITQNNFEAMVAYAKTGKFRRK